MTTALLGSGIAVLLCVIWAVIERHRAQTARTALKLETDHALALEAEVKRVSDISIDQAKRMDQLSENFRARLREVDEALAKCTDPDAVRVRLNQLLSG